LNLAYLRANINNKKSIELKCKTEKGFLSFIGINIYFSFII